MKKHSTRIIQSICLGTAILLATGLYGQEVENCFLVGAELKTSEIPPSEYAAKTNKTATVRISITGDTIGRISDYMFGNAIAAWSGSHSNSTFVEGVKNLAPSLIRWPGGSWSNGWFLDGVPADVPDSIYDGTSYDGSTGTAKKNKFYGNSGTDGGWKTTTDNYYTLRERANVTEGLITINYGYARYGTSEDPVAQAAHEAAEWVRYDNGRTKFWEIGNENAGPWEYGWMIDTTLNKDGQPVIINGSIYGKHFRVFADSMKSAAAEIGSTIYIGGQVLHYNGVGSWNIADREWNQGFFEEVGDAADFYVMHNYFSSSNNVKEILTYAKTEVKANSDYIKQDIIDQGASARPLALTEYGIGFGDGIRGTSYVNGMQAVVLIGELINNNYGLGARWLLLSGGSGMIDGSSNHPRPDFYYLTYLPKFYGDYAISASSSNPDVFCYVSRFSSGETGLVIVNIGTQEQVVQVDPGPIEAKGKYYVFSFTGGSDNGDFSQNVYINGQGPDAGHWGPYNSLFEIPAKAYAIGNEMKIISPARSIQMALIERDGNTVILNSETVSSSSGQLNLNSHPNPVNSSTVISYELPRQAFVVVKILDLQGREVATLVNEKQKAGYQSIELNVSDLPEGVYLCKVDAGKYQDTKKLIVAR